MTDDAMPKSIAGDYDLSASAIARRTRKRATVHFTSCGTLPRAAVSAHPPCDSESEQFLGALKKG